MPGIEDFVLSGLAIGPAIGRAAPGRVGRAVYDAVAATRRLHGHQHEPGDRAAAGAHRRGVAGARHRRAAPPAGRRPAGAHPDRRAVGVSRDPAGPPGRPRAEPGRRRPPPADPRAARGHAGGGAPRRRGRRVRPRLRGDPGCRAAGAAASGAPRALQAGRRRPGAPGGARPPARHARSPARPGSGPPRPSRHGRAGSLRAGGLHTARGRAAARRLDRALRADGNRLNPGASADLVTAALFVALLEGGRADERRIPSSSVVGRASAYAAYAMVGRPPALAADSLRPRAARSSALPPRA